MTSNVSPNERHLIASSSLHTHRAIARARMPTLHIASYASQIDQAAKFQDGATLASLLSLTDKHGPMVLDFLAKPDRGTAWIDRTLETVRPGAGFPWWV